MLNALFRWVALRPMISGVSGPNEAVRVAIFGAKADSGVRIDPKPSPARRLLDPSTEVAIARNRPHPSLNCAHATRSTRDSGSTGRSGTAELP